MATSSHSEPYYANWVSSKLAYVPAFIAFLLGALSIASPWLALPAVLFFAVSAYFAYARWQFSPQGAGIQPRIQTLVLRQVDWDGKGRVLDIGCGNGPLTIALAKAHPDARVTGIDLWGTSWEYSKAVCERNAAIEGVAQSVTFQKGSAVALPFDDGTFDLVVSNLVFHEVRGVSDKRLLVKEAIRVLRKGAQFVFQDLFLWKQVYGDPTALVGEIRSWGIDRVELLPTNNLEFIPKALKLPFMIGTIAILHGRK
jgi:SAM-dependent methyltransferase